MLPWRRTGVIVCGLCLVAAAARGSGPVPVSPGEPSEFAAIADSCPTFTWSLVAEAQSYELVVHRVVESALELEPVLDQAIVGGASGWTPALGRCLDRGERYAWSIRSWSNDVPSAWSSPNLFRVALVADTADPEGLSLQLRRHLEPAPADGASKGTRVAAYAEPTESAEPDSAAAGNEDEAVGSSQLSVDGEVVAGSFAGDGSALTALKPANLSSAVAIAQGGTGAANPADARTNLGVAAGPHATDTTCHGQPCDGSQLVSVNADLLDGTDSSGFASSGALSDVTVAICDLFVVTATPFPSAGVSCACRASLEGCGLPEHCCGAADCVGEICCTSSQAGCGSDEDCCVTDCAAGICCNELNRSCTAVSDCCDADDCVTDKCCNNAQSACSGMVDCCPPHICQSGTCCSPGGQACATSDDCCTSDCTSGTCCSELFGPCASHDDCCGTLCQSGNCCTPGGESCSADEECCSGNCGLISRTCD